MVAAERRLAPGELRAHERARGKGEQRLLYALARGALSPSRLWFRVRVRGAGNIPAQGAALVAPNHKSFMDAFLIGLVTRRHVRYMTKAEVFRGPLGWILVRLGAFPVRRGEADAESLATARAILAAGGLVVVFPEGTRVDEPDALGSPHHGAARLALETGAPIVPTAIVGTHHLWLGPIPKPRLVRIAFHEPVAIADLADDHDALVELMDRRVWPAVQDEYVRLRAMPGVIAAALAAIGVGGLVARRRATATRPRLLGIVQPRKIRRRNGRASLLERLRLRR